jgi:hypothetical protein
MKSITRLVVPDDMEIEITLRLTVGEARTLAKALHAQSYHATKEHLADTLQRSLEAAMQQVSIELPLDRGMPADA